MNYKAIIFDLDDTLIDFQAAQSRGLNFIYHHFFASCELADFTQAYESINRRLWDAVGDGQMLPREVGLERFRALSSHLRVSVDFEHVAATYELKISETVEWMPGAKACIKQLSPNYRLGIVTNGLQAAQRRKLSHMGVSDDFHSVVISEEFGVAKPHPHVFKHILGQMDCLPEACLMVGDSLGSDYQGAMNVGMDFCWFNPHHQALPSMYARPRMEVAHLSGLMILEEA